MTYKKLLQKLQLLTEKQLNHDITMHDDIFDEYHKVNVKLHFADDIDQPIISF
jgi:hypothetical protein